MRVIVLCDHVRGFRQLKRPHIRACDAVPLRHRIVLGIVFAGSALAARRRARRVLERARLAFSAHLASSVKCAFGAFIAGPAFLHVRVLLGLKLQSAVHSRKDIEATWTITKPEYGAVYLPCRLGDSGLNLVITVAE